MLVPLRPDPSMRQFRTWTETPPAEPAPDVPPELRRERVARCFEHVRRARQCGVVTTRAGAPVNHKMLRAFIDSIYRDGKVTGESGREFPLRPHGISQREGEALRDLAIREGAARTIETGACLGLSTLFLCDAIAQATHSDVEHVAIESPPHSWDHASTRVIRDAGLTHLVELHGTSPQLVLPRLLDEGMVFDLAFVDGDHGFDGAFVDLYYLHQIVRPGGLIVVDEVWQPAVRLAVLYFVMNVGFEVVPEPVAGPAFIGRPEGRWDHLKGEPRPTMAVLRRPLELRQRPWDDFIPFAGWEATRRSLPGSERRSGTATRVEEGWEPVGPTMPPPTAMAAPRVNAIDLDALRSFIRSVYGSDRIIGENGKVFSLQPQGFSERDGEALRDLAMREGAFQTIETGLCYGLSSLFLCEAVAASGRAEARHVAIDPFQKRHLQSAGLRVLDAAGVADIVEFHDRMSQVVLPELLSDGRTFDLAFVDGDHRFEGVFLDIHYLHQLVRPGGLIVVDDVWMPSVRLAVTFFVTNVGLELVPSPFPGPGFVPGPAQWRHRIRGSPTAKVAVLRRPVELPTRPWWGHFIPFADRETGSIRPRASAWLEKEAEPRLLQARSLLRALRRWRATR